MPQICRNVSSAAAPGASEGRELVGVLHARAGAPITGEAGLERERRAPPRCSASTCDAHSPVARPPPGPRAAAVDATSVVGIVAVAPPTTGSARASARRATPARAAARAPARAAPAAPSGPDHEQRQPLERHRVVAGQVDEVRRRRHHDGRQPASSASLRGQPLASGRSWSAVIASAGSIGAPPGTSRACVPSSSPSATTGSGRRRRSTTRILRAHLADVRIAGRGRRAGTSAAAACRRPIAGPVKTRTSSDAVARERARRQPHPARRRTARCRRSR